MPIVSFQEGNELYDITPIENIFILEYMQNAPGEYVKVYLLGLLKCYHAKENYTISRMASDLSISDDEVKQAFTYWAQFGLVEILSRRPYEVSFLNIKKTMQKTKGPRVNLYTHQPLVLALQKIFGGKRLLGPSEINFVMEWVDEWKVPPEVIILITNWCVSMKGERIRFSYVNKVLSDIYDQDLTTYTQVEDYIHQTDTKMSGATAVLKTWNMNRLPTADEVELYRKWTQDYNVHKDAIREAQKQMTGINNPNYKYLDSLIEKLYKNNIKSANDAVKYFMENEGHRKNAKEIYSRLGGLRLTDERMKRYEGWRNMGFSQYALLTAADALSHEGYKSPDDLNNTLIRWHKQVLISDKKIDAYMATIKASAQQVSLLLEAWEENRAPKNYERRIYLSWIQKELPKKLIDLACKKAENAKDKMVYADRILSNWVEQGIKTIQQAQKQTSVAFTSSKKEKELPKDDYFNLYNSWEEL
ncbi:MAG: DnaD domain protein [Clostridiales bacterium]|nr:DnaD domain protein [Clostridiales bacterium]